MKDLEFLLNPRSIAILGASADLSKINGRTLKYLLAKGYRGKIFPVNPKYPRIGELPCYPDIASLPEAPDLAVVAVPARAVIDSLRELGRRGAKAAVVFSSGFSEMGDAGRKSANALVHWVEATSALYAATGDDAVRRALVEALDLCRDPVFPADPGETDELFLADWTPDPRSEHRASYGHNVEYAWLMLHAQDALGEPRDWDRFHTYLDHTLRVGVDDQRGGAFTTGHGEHPADVRRKLWWVQCELMNALTVALVAQPDERYERALARTIGFVEQSMTDRRDGILLEEVEEDGRRRWPRKSGNWKAGYHDVRAATMLVDAFAP